MGATPDFSAGCAYINGRFLPIGEAAIPITDFGFTRSDCTYDVVSVWRGSFFRLNDHLHRFQRAWQRINMTPTFTLDDVAGVVHECVRRSGIRDAYVEMIITRGIPEPGNRDPRQMANRLYAYAIPYVWLVELDDQLIGTDLIVAKDAIRISPDAVDPTVKNFHWGDLTRGLYEAYERGAKFAVLLDAEGQVTEGPGFNIFAYHDGALLTPPDRVLQGITRRTIMDLADEQGVPCVAENIDGQILAQAQEIFLTSTAGGVIPVVTLDGAPVADGKPGQLTLSLRELYWDAHARPEWTTAVDYGETASVSVLFS